MNRFANKVVIVTGGGSGIGRVTAAAFAREGAQVIVADIEEAGGRKVVEGIVANGGKAKFIHFDAGNVDSVNALIEATVGEFGQLDVLFNNAAILDGFAFCTQTSDEVWSGVLNVNLSGYFYAARAALPHLVKSRGNIVMTSSAAGLGAMAAGTAYTVSKHAVTGLVNQIACEVAAQGVRVNAVAPGAVLTELARSLPNLDEITETSVKLSTPMGRWAEPEEIAEPVLFLASAAASYITGVILRVDGGWRSK